MSCPISTVCHMTELWDNQEDLATYEPKSGRPGQTPTDELANAIKSEPAKTIFIASAVGRMAMQLGGKSLGCTRTGLSE